MSVLSDREIFKAIEKKMISIDPLTNNSVQPASIDLTLFNSAEVFEKDFIDLRNIDQEDLKQSTKFIDISDGYTIDPGEYFTGYTNEHIHLSSFYNGRISNRNSITKIGLNAAINTYINPGFSGRMPLVIFNFSRHPIKIYPGIRICQLEIYSLEGEAIRSYDDRYDESKLSSYVNAIRKKEMTNSVDLNDTYLSDFLKDSIQKATIGNY